MKIKKFNKNATSFNVLIQIDYMYSRIQITFEKLTSINYAFGVCIFNTTDKSCRKKNY